MSIEETLAICGRDLDRARQREVEYLLEIKALNERIDKAKKDLRMAALSDDCVLHLSAYLGAISHDLDGGD